MFSGVFCYKNSRTLEFLGVFLCVMVIFLLLVALEFFSQLPSELKVRSIFIGILVGLILSGVTGVFLTILAVLDIMLGEKKTEELVYILGGDKSEVVLPPPGPAKEDVDIFNDRSIEGSVATLPPEVITDPAVLMLARDSQGKWTYKGVEGNKLKEEEKSQASDSSKEAL